MSDPTSFPLRRTPPPSSCARSARWSLPRRAPNRGRGRRRCMRRRRPSPRTRCRPTVPASPRWRRRHVTPYLTSHISRYRYRHRRSGGGVARDLPGAAHGVGRDRLEGADRRPLGGGGAERGALRTREALPCLWSRPQISRPASPATLQVPNAVLFGAKSGRPYAEHMALEVSASRTLATACGSYARALGFTQVPPSLRWGRDTCLVTPHLTPHIPATGATVAALRADDGQYHL